MTGVRAQLLHGAGTERVSRRNQHAMPVVVQPECDLLLKHHDDGTNFDDENTPKPKPTLEN